MDAPEVVEDATKWAKKNKGAAIAGGVILAGGIAFIVGSRNKTPIAQATPPRTATGATADGSVVTVPVNGPYDPYTDIFTTRLDDITDTIGQLGVTIGSLQTQLGNLKGPAPTTEPVYKPLPIPARQAPVTSSPISLAAPQSVQSLVSYGSGFDSTYENTPLAWAPEPAAGSIVAPPGGALSYGSWSGDFSQGGVVTNYNSTLTSGVYNTPGGMTLVQRLNSWAPSAMDIAATAYGASYTSGGYSVLDTDTGSGPVVPPSSRIAGMNYDRYGRTIW